MFFVRKAGARAGTTAHAARLNPGDDMQQQVFALVNERLRTAFGASGMWNVTLRKTGDTETLFGATVAETLAWDVAAHLAPASTPHVGAHKQAHPETQQLHSPGAGEKLPTVIARESAGGDLNAAGAAVAVAAVAGSADVVAPGPTKRAQEVFVTPVFSSFGPPVPVTVAVVPTGLAAAVAVAVALDYVGPTEWSQYGPPSLESLVQSVASPTARAEPAHDIHSSVA